MSYQDEIAFFAEQEGFATTGRATAVAARNYPLLAMNCRQLFKLRLMMGLISWRHGQDPRDDFRLAITRLAGDADALLAMDSSKSPEGQLPSASALILSFLLGQGELAARAASDDVQGKLDVVLARALQGNNAHEEATTLIASAAKKSSLRLLASSYQNYFDIIASPPDTEGVRGLVESSEKMYKSRSTTSYFSGGDQTEGGGPDNDLVVDYRLAAALKKNGSSIDSVHSWKWG